MKTRLALIVAVILGAIATLGVYSVVQNVKIKARRETVMVTVLRSARNLERGEQFLSEMVDSKQLPQIYLSDRFIKSKDMNSFLGRKLVTSIKAGEYVMDFHFPPPGATVFSEVVQPGRRAVSIPVSGAPGVSGLLRAGHNIDVLTTFEVKPAEAREGGVQVPDIASFRFNRKNPVEYVDQRLKQYNSQLRTFFQRVTQKSGASSKATMTLLQNVRVLAVDAFVGKEGEASAALIEEIKNYAAITVELDPPDAQLLVFALGAGTLHIVLRNERDTAKNPIAPVTMESVVYDKLKETGKKKKRGEGG